MLPRRWCLLWIVFFISVHCSIRTSGGYFPAFLTVHVAALEFDGGCLCTCRETGQISEVVMPMIWFEEVRLSLTHMEAVAVLVTLDRTLTLTLNPPGAASVSPLFPPLLCCNYCSDHFVPGSACERPNVLLSVWCPQMKTSVQIQWSHTTLLSIM